jgi:14-3-3 protein epsilon
MVDYATQFAKLEGELNIEERNILSVAYKNVVGSRRAAWRVLTSIEQKEAKKGNSYSDQIYHLCLGNAENEKQVKDYKAEIELELQKLCDDILDLLDKHLIPAAPSVSLPSLLH